MPVFNLKKFAPLKDYISKHLNYQSTFILEKLELDNLISIEPLSPQQPKDAMIYMDRNNKKEIQQEENELALEPENEELKLNQIRLLPLPNDRTSIKIYQELANTSKTLDLAKTTALIDRYKDDNYLLHKLIYLLEKQPNSIKLINQLLKNPNINPNEKLNGATPLRLAIQKNQPEVVKALLAHPEINLELELIEKLLEHPDIEINFSTAKIIGLLKKFNLPQQLEVIAQLRSVKPLAFKLNEALHDTKTLDVQEMSVMLGDLDALIEKYPLHIAIQLLKTNPNIIKLLDKLITAENIHLKINGKLTPLDLAIKNEQIEAIIKLLNHPTIEITPSNREQILKLIILTDDRHAFNSLLMKENFFKFITSNFDKLLKYAESSPKLSVFIAEFKKIFEELMGSDSLQSVPRFVSKLLYELNNNLDSSDNTVRLLSITARIQNARRKKGNM